MAGVGALSRRPLMVATSVVLMSAVLLPFSHHQFASSIAFMPAMLSVVVCFDVLSVYLLIGDYHDQGDRRLLVMAWAYAWSLMVMAGYGLAFPGGVAAEPPLAVTRSMAPYLYVTWHAGFPTLLAAAWAPWPARWTTPTPVSRRRIVSTLSVTGAAASGAVVVALIVGFAHRLPILIQGVDTSRMTTLTAPVAVPLVALSLAVAVYGLRRRTGPERWAAVAILVCLCDLVLTYNARTRYSLGWYYGRSLTLVSAAVVLLAMLAVFRQLKAKAEHDAVVDSLTGLTNRRGAHTSLNQLFALARRSDSALSVISLDLDRFKQINDQYGHETGDLALAEVGRLLSGACRQGDTVARVGGEEFLVILPDADELNTLVVAERIRSKIASLDVPGLPQVTASLGVTALRVDDLDPNAVLRRADIALYEAKQSGRNRVVTSPPAEKAPPGLTPVS